MKILIEEPFNLRHGDAIIVHASAKNALGWSLPSKPHAEYVVLT